jgi:hypothetical protein
MNSRWRFWVKAWERGLAVMFRERFGDRLGSRFHDRLGERLSKHMGEKFGRRSGKLG